MLMASVDLHGCSKVFLMGGKGNNPLLDGRKPPSSRSLRLNPVGRRRAAQAVLMAPPTSISTFDHPFPHGQAAPYYYCDNFFNTNTKEEEEGKENNKRRSREAVTPEKLDAWLRDSIHEIVRNIRDAPFLVKIFSSGGPTASRPSVVKLEREAASPENWSCISKRWDNGSCIPPDGIILVEELKDEEEDTEDDDDARRHCSKAWGLVVQGRGLDCVACYILNTCRVKSSMGFCTHFCLVRAKCFGEPTEIQLRKAWLQQGN